MYVVTKNNPFYPDVEYCETMEEAEKQLEEWIEDLREPDGEYNCKITIAEEIKTIEIKSYQ